MTRRRVSHLASQRTTTASGLPLPQPLDGLPTRFEAAWGESRLTIDHASEYDDLGQRYRSCAVAHDGVLAATGRPDRPPTRDRSGRATTSARRSPPDRPRPPAHGRPASSSLRSPRTHPSVPGPDARSTVERPVNGEAPSAPHARSRDAGSPRRFEPSVPRFPQVRRRTDGSPASSVTLTAQCSSARCRTWWGPETEQGALHDSRGVGTLAQRQVRAIHLLGLGSKVARVLF